MCWCRMCRRARFSATGDGVTNAKGCFSATTRAATAQREEHTTQPEAVTTACGTTRPPPTVRRTGDGVTSAKDCSSPAIPAATARRAQHTTQLGAATIVCTRFEGLGGSLLIERETTRIAAESPI